MTTLVANHGAALEHIEGAMLKMPQVECAVINRFGPGIYIRELHIPAGTTLIGHAHKTPHSFMVLSGRLQMFNDDGSSYEIVAPAFLVADTGRKVAFAQEDTIVQNIHATDETDIQKLEELLIEKSQTFLDHSKGERYVMDGSSSSR